MAHSMMLSPSPDAIVGSLRAFADAIPLRKVIRSNFLR
jgi:hypothetical protein